MWEYWTSKTRKIDEKKLQFFQTEKKIKFVEDGDVRLLRQGILMPKIETKLETLFLGKKISEEELISLFTLIPDSLSPIKTLKVTRDLSENSYLVFHQFAVLLKETTMIEEFEIDCNKILKPQRDEVLKALNRNRSLKRIDFEKWRFELREVKEIVRKNTNYERLTFESVTAEQDVGFLAQEIRKKNSLKCLEIKNFLDYDRSSLIMGMKMNYVPKQITLSGKLMKKYVNKEELLLDLDQKRDVTVILLETKEVKDSEVRNLVPQLKELDLKSLLIVESQVREQGSKQFRTLFNSIPQDAMLLLLTQSYVYCKHIPFDEQFVTEISEFLSKQKSKIRNVELLENRIEEADMINLLHTFSLTQFENLENLTLNNMWSSGNPCNLDIAKEISHLIVKCRSLHTLDLKSNALQDVIVSNLLSNIKNEKLEKLNLSENQMTDDAAKDLASFVDNNLNLKEICLENNKIGPICAQVIGEALFKNFKLNKINLSHNTLGNDGANSIAAGLTQSTTMEYAILADIQLEGFDPRAETFLTESKSLRELNLSGNRLTNQICDILEIAFEHNKKLENIDLSGNKISNFWQIIFGLTKNSNLKIVNLSKNEFERDGFFAFIEFLQNNFSIEWIDLSNNYGGTDDVTDTEVIFQLLAFNKTLKYINLGKTSSVVMEDKATFLQFEQPSRIIVWNGLNIRNYDDKKTTEIE